MNIAPDRLENLRAKYSERVRQDVPPKLAFMELCVGERLSSTEIDGLWDGIITDPEKTAVTMEEDAPGVAHAASKLDLANLMNQLEALRTKAAAERTAHIRDGLVYPATLLLQAARGVVDALDTAKPITATNIEMTIIERDNEFGILSKMANKVIEVDSTWEEQGYIVNAMLMTSVACILENKGYAYDPRTLTWKMTGVK